VLPGTIRTLRAAIAALVFAAVPAGAGEFEFSGSVAGEVRVFPSEPQFDGQFSHLQPSAILSPELSYRSDDDRQQAKIVPFLRLDGQDSERTHGDLREGYWRTIQDQWDLLIGVNTVFWGVTESRHLINVINQVDQVENSDEEDFLGQPMVNLGSQRDWGRVDLFVLPGFRERSFPGRDGRLRASLPVDEGAARYESDLGQANVDVALRYSHFIGDWDVGAYLFRGTGREPRLVANAASTRLEPRYDLINQAGLDLQYTIGEWLWKLEAIAREGQGETFAAAVGGFEYTFFQAFGTDADLGLLAEYQYDGRDSAAPTTVADNDVFAGARLALNDFQDATALLGTLVDAENRSTALFIEAERRLGDNWKLELESRWFLNAERTDPLAAIEDDDFIQLRVSYFF
jgi:hypothetical protein